MKLLNSNGKLYSVQVEKHIVHLDDIKKKSSLHLTARKIIAKIFNTDIILEEVPVKINSKTLYLDFLVPSIKIGVEVNGEQHYQFNPLFHKSKQDFIKAKKNDVIKQDWANINNIKLIYLPFNKQNEWRDLIVTELCN